MTKVSKVYHKVNDYLDEAGYEKWSRFHALINRGRMMTSNIAKCINGCLAEVSQIPILEFLEEVKIYVGHENIKIRK